LTDLRKPCAFFLTGFTVEVVATAMSADLWEDVGRCLLADTAVRLVVPEFCCCFPELGRKPPAENWKLFSKFFAMELWLLLN
jgi:hypothetical protein